ncbi:unnamed protein product, partial [Symbiodinium necroappetens]
DPFYILSLLFVAIVFDGKLPEGVLEEEPHEYEGEVDGGDQGEYLAEDEPNALDDDAGDDEEELVPDEGQEPPEEDSAVDDSAAAIVAAAQALTVTSKKLAGLVQGRGFYNVDAKGKGRSGKGHGGDKGKSGKGKAKSKGRGGPKGKAPARKGGGKAGNGQDRQQRLRGSLCLGCGSADHWIRDCPH